MNAPRRGLDYAIVNTEKMERYASIPELDMINGPLMKGMEEVGRLFNNNELIVAEVLQSAEVMKASVAFLEPHMEKNESAFKGKILLATVKGDVHDIGQNLVEIILSNNGCIPLRSRGSRSSLLCVWPISCDRRRAV